jgi:glycosyltransferase involved in cell wall biosynthesis
MNIAIDISVLRIAQAGVLVYTRSLVDALAAERGAHELTLLDVLPLNPGLPMRPLPAFDAPGVRVVRCPGLRRGYFSSHPRLRAGLRHALAERIDRALDASWSAASVAAMGLALRGGLAGATVFHASDQFLHAPPGAATVLTIHDLTTVVHPEWHVEENRRRHAAKGRFAATRAHHIIADSEATRTDVVRHLGVPPERVTVVHLGYDERFRPLDAASVAGVLWRYGLRAGGYILSLGTLEPRKNYERLIEAYARLAAEHLGAEAPPLVIAGGNGWQYEPIRAAPARCGVERSVRFLGRVPDEDLPALVAGAALFVYPSLYEGFGLPPLEALAAGVPVVTSNSSSLPEVVGDAALLCDPLDPADIARHMAAPLSDDRLAARLRDSGPLRAARFSWRRTARETLAVYEGVAGSVATAR